MKRDFFIFSNGEIKRKDNTIFIINEATEKKAIPIETIRSLYLFGEISLNTKLLNFLSQNDIILHVFNYYGFYSGSYYPKDTLLSGYILVEQVKAFTSPKKRLELAKETIDSALCNINKNLLYYQSRGKTLEQAIESLKKMRTLLESCQSVDEVMGVEGQSCQIYYAAFNTIVNQDIHFEKRVKHPPDNMINTLISFTNTLLYTATLSQIYQTQLNPTVSFLHSPGYRRYSLALDISEIFKPILADRIIFRVLNKNMITEDDFDTDLNFCYMKESAKKVLIREFDEQLNITIKHRTLNRSFSYRHLIRLECYKLIKFLTDKKEYKAFRIWW